MSPQESDTRFLVDQITEQLLGELVDEPSFSGLTIQALRDLAIDGSLNSVPAVKRALRVDEAEVASEGT